MPGRVDALTYRRGLRQTSTPAERRLWTVFRAGRLDGLHVRRQHTAGSYVLDFHCPEARLAIELDGSVHDDPARAAYDARRQTWLAAEGIDVVRFENGEVFSGIEAVAAAILATARSRIAATKPLSVLPDISPLGGEKTLS